MQKLCSNPVLRLPVTLVTRAITHVSASVERYNGGMIPGPTFYTAGRIIAPYGGQFQMQPDKQKLGEPEYFYADTRDEMVKAIRENIHYGATVIKIVVDDQQYIYSVEDIKFMIDEAARAGVKLAAHCWTLPERAMRRWLASPRSNTDSR